MSLFCPEPYEVAVFSSADFYLQGYNVRSQRLTASRLPNQGTGLVQSQESIWKTAVQGRRPFMAHRQMQDSTTARFRALLITAKWPCIKIYPPGALHSNPAATLPIHTAAWQGCRPLPPERGQPFPPPAPCSKVSRSSPWGLPPVHLHSCWVEQ